MQDQSEQVEIEANAEQPAPARATPASERNVAMVIVAHPDDAEFGCAGTLAVWAREGWDVYQVIITDGSAGGPDEATDVSPEARQKVVETRQAEQRRAAEILGVKDVIFLGYHDGELQPTLELRRDLVRLLRKYRVSRLLVQSPVRTWLPVYQIGRYHPDHLASGEAAMAAVYPAAQNPWDFPELMAEGLTPHKVAELFVMGAPTVNVAVDISSTIDQKIEALRAHHSQLGGHFAMIERWMRTGAADRGARHGMAFAEEFHRTQNF
ncbi:MAG TPA: PIG-L deacetylase family protein [Thermomicrobiaceae bacterium]|nr:PIG-L deacetylase family protein [Thermomicrobiaceae bacterium]